MKLNSGANSSRNGEEKSRGSQKKGNKNINLKEVRQKKDFIAVGAGNLSSRMSSTPRDTIINQNSHREISELQYG